MVLSMEPTNHCKKKLHSAYQAYVKGNYSNCSSILMQAQQNYSNKNEWYCVCLNLALSESKRCCTFYRNEYRDNILSHLPKLNQPIKRVSGYIEGVAAFNLALSSFVRNNCKRAVELLQSVLDSNHLPSSLHIMALFLEIEMCLKFGRLNFALQRVNHLRADPIWRHAQTFHSDCLDYLECRIRCRLGDFARLPSFIKNERVNFTYRCLMEVECCMKNGNVDHALKKLLSIRLSVEDMERRLIDNAIGCVYAFSIKNSQFAECYFRSAMASVQENFEKANEAGIAKYNLIHNAALAQLHSGQSESAFQLFLSVLPFYAGQPRIWLRLAECCIATLQKNQYRSDPVQIIEVAKKVIPKTRHIILAQRQVAEDLSRDMNKSLRINEISWEYADHCVQNALLLAGGIQKHAYLIPWIYAASAFINLNLGRYSISLRFANQLENVPRISQRHKLLAVLYKTEALVMLDRIRDAIRTLNQCHLSKTIDHLSLVVAYNKILLQTLNGNLRKLNSELNKLWEQSHVLDNFKLLSLGVYINMKMNRQVEAKKLIENRAYNTIHFKNQ